MSTGPSLPFRLSVPGEDVIDAEGVRSVSYKLEGRVHFDHDLLRFEWAGSRTTEQVSFKWITWIVARIQIGTDVSESPVGTAAVPVDAIIDVRVRGGWWWPQIVLRSHSLETFAEIPSARPGTLILKIRRADREQARAFAETLNVAATTGTLEAGQPQAALENPDSES